MIFISLFKVSSPSMNVIVLNIIMITVVILLFPVLNEISGYVRSLVDVHSVDLVYIVKKLNALSKEYINYPELAEFLAQHLHFQYIGLIVNNKLYSSKAVKVSNAEVDKINKLKAGKHGVWVEMNKDVKELVRNTGAEGVAVLKDSHGEEVGKILIGRPLGGINFNSRDLGEIETALTLLAVAISSDKGFRE